MEVKVESDDEDDDGILSPAELEQWRANALLKGNVEMVSLSTLEQHILYKYE